MPPKGLASVAFLRAQLDEGQDHLGMFEPLVLDALLRLPAGDCVAADVRGIINERTGIQIPIDTVQTLLGRAVRKQYLRREGGRFLRTTKQIPDPTLDEHRREAELRLTILATALIDFAAADGLTINSVEDALSALSTFVSDNKIPLVLQEVLPDSPLERSALDKKLIRVIARFITERCLGANELRTVLIELVEGMVVQDVLLFKDVQQAERRFRNLLVVLDTSILFSALELTGISNAVAVKESLGLLRECGARTVTFRCTVDEMRKILAVYEQHVATSEGRMTLYPTDLTHHILTARLSQYDIRMISATLDKRLEQIGVGILEVSRTRCAIHPRGGGSKRGLGRHSIAR